MSRLSGNEAVGVEIDDAEIRLAVAAPAGDGYVVRAHRRPLPQGAVEADHVVDADAVAETLRGLLAAAGVRPRRAHVVLGGSQTVCRVEPISDPQDSAVVAACSDRMRRYVVFGGQPAVVGHTLQNDTGSGEGPAWLLSAATLSDLVLRQVAVAKRCGMTVVAAEPAMAALVHTLLATDGPDRARFLMVEDDTGCEVGVLRRDGLIFCQRLPVGVDALRGDGDGDDGRGASALTATLERLEDYHLRHAGGREPIEELLWCGDGAGLEGLFQRLGDVGIRVERLDPGQFPGVVGFEGDGAGEAAGRSAMAPAAAGALAAARGAGGPGRLSLLPAPKRSRRHRFLVPWVVVPLVATFLATAGLVTADWLLRRQADRLVYLINHPTAQMLACAELQRRESGLKRRAADARLLLASARRAEEPAFLGELSRRMPSEVWLDRVELARDGGCVIAGMAQAEDAVFVFAESLRQSPCVVSVRIGGTGTERDGGMILTRFRLEAALVLKGGAVQQEGGS